jgi:raffinose/stachyose/melibiose transport system substrate-binding protein
MRLHPSRSGARSVSALAALTMAATIGVTGVRAADADPSTLNVWLGGILTTATPGSTFRTYVDEQVARFEAAHPGTKVELTLLPANNDQLAAQVQAAFAADEVPDAMMLYSGSYTLAYEDGLLTLNDYVDATPGFFDQMGGWEASCADLDCQDGAGTILAVPADVLTFVMFYNKDLLAQAGIEAPATTYEELYAQCEALKQAGITPIAYGDLQGWTTDNYLLVDLVSHFEDGDVQRFIDGDLKFTDPAFVDSLTAIAELKARGCVQPDATTRDQFEATSDVLAGTAAMIEGYPQFLPTLEPALGDKLGVAALPVSGDGPWKDRSASNSGEGWVIPAAAKNPDLAWEWIKQVSDEEAGLAIEKYIGIPPANKAAHAKMTDPYLQFIAELTNDAAIPLLDNVMAQDVALVFYKEIQQAFAGTKTPTEALQAVQDYADQQEG